MSSKSDKIVEAILSTAEKKPKRISHKEQFEDCYLRHKYIKRIKSHASNTTAMPYNGIVLKSSRNTFYTYNKLFYSIGILLDDIVNINTMHLYTFLDLFALEKQNEKMELFKKVFKKRHKKEPNPLELLDKNKADFTIFLNQRMEDLVRICKQKSRNIKGVASETVLCLVGPEDPTLLHEKLYNNYEELGFRKIDPSVFRLFRKKAKVNNIDTFSYNNRWYIALPIEQKPLEVIDFAGANLDPHDNIHNMCPEVTLVEKEEKQFWEQKQKLVDSYSDKRKKNMYKNFIKKHKDNDDYKEELKIARYLLKTLYVSY